MNIKLPLTFVVILLICSCSKQETAFSGTTVTLTETIDSTFFAVNESSTGLLLFYSDFLEGTYQIPHEEGVKVDFTAGTLSSLGNTLVTTREIESPFNYGEGSATGCSFPDFGAVLLGGRDYTLRITGISSYEELYVPFLSESSNQEVYIEDNSLVIQGKIYRKNRHNFTVKLNSSDEYQTYSVDFEDWSEQSNTLVREIQANNYEIFPYFDFPIGGNTYNDVTIKAQIAENKFVTIPAKGEYQSSGNNDFIRFFYSNDYFNYYIRAFLFSADGSSTSLIKHYNSLNENPEMWKPEWDSIEKIEGGLIFPHYEDADLVRVKCIYRKNLASTLSWGITYNTNITSNFYFPELPNSQAEVVNEFLEIPEEYFLIKGTKYPEGEINSNGYCPDELIYEYYQQN